MCGWANAHILVCCSSAVLVELMLLHAALAWLKAAETHDKQPKQQQLDAFVQQLAQRSKYICSISHLLWLADLAITLSLWCVMYTYIHLQGHQTQLWRGNTAVAAVSTLRVIMGL